MKNKGFTLIELLAVIVILAIIALIATPIIINIIEDTKDSANKRSIDLYGKAVENAIANYQVKNTSDSEITLEKIKPYIEYKGNEVKCGVYVNSDGSVYLEGCSVNGKKVEYTYGVDTLTFKKVQEENKTLAGNIPQGNFEPGDEYIIDVDGTNKYHFYVLSTEEDKVNLIMSRNICSDGTLATSSNTCLIPWVSKIDYNDDNNYATSGNNKGPITAMNYLYEVTKNWNNVENIYMNYIDEGNKYGGITTNNSTTTMTMKDGTITATYENLKARLPYYLEFVNLNCTEINGSCPAHTVNGTIANKNFYPDGTRENINKIYGYWLLSSKDSFAWAINRNGHIHRYTISGNNSYGIRPVITVSKSDLS